MDVIKPEVCVPDSDGAILVARLFPTLKGPVRTTTGTENMFLCKSW